MGERGDNPPVAKRLYTQEEVSAILERALERQKNEVDKLSHEDLVSAAEEAGIPREAVDAAARDLIAPREPEADDASDRTKIVGRWKRRAWVAFSRHLVVYVLVNLMLAFINLATSRAFLWFLVVVLGWGIGLAMHAMGVLFADEDRIVERARLREAWRARREASRTMAWISSAP